MISATLALLLMVIGHVPGWRASRQGFSPGRTGFGSPACSPRSGHDEACPSRLLARPGRRRSRGQALAVGSLFWVGALAVLTHSHGFATALIAGFFLWCVAAAGVIWVGGRP